METAQKLILKYVSLSNIELSLCIQTRAAVINSQIAL
jgi:hypothetical protein